MAENNLPFNAAEIFAKAGEYFANKTNATMQDFLESYNLQPEVEKWNQYDRASGAYDQAMEATSESDIDREEKEKSKPKATTRSENEQEPSVWDMLMNNIDGFMRLGAETANAAEPTKAPDMTDDFLGEAYAPPSRNNEPDTNQGNQDKSRTQATLEDLGFTQNENGEMVSPDFPIPIKLSDGSMNQSGIPSLAGTELDSMLASDAAKNLQHSLDRLMRPTNTPPQRTASDTDEEYDKDLENFAKLQGYDTYDDWREEAGGLLRQIIDKVNNARENPTTAAGIDNTTTDMPSIADAYYEWLNTDKGKEFAKNFADYADQGNQGYTRLRASRDRDAFDYLLNNFDDYRNRYAAAGYDLSDPATMLDNFMNRYYGEDAVDAYAWMFNDLGSLGNSKTSLAEASDYLNAMYNWGTFDRFAQSGLTPDDIRILTLAHNLSNAKGVWDPNISLSEVGDLMRAAGDYGDWSFVDEGSDEYEKRGHNNPWSYKSRDLAMMTPDEALYTGFDSKNPIWANAVDMIQESYNNSNNKRKAVWDN